MGGARCSYRTCTIRSDNKLHMFHYPVFDKIRCHQWMINAQRLNFLDLKLSQLKNRVICEHHFKDDSFMNVTRAKLKNSAVPTEDGPFCVKSITDQKDNGESPVILDDIENENLTTLEKQAHFSVKYGDFLINDVREPSLLVPKYNSTPIKLRAKGMMLKSPLTKRVRVRGNLTANRVVDTNVSDTRVVNAVPCENITLPNPLSSLYENKSIPNPECLVVAIEFDDLNLNGTEQSNKYREILPVQPLDQEFSGGNIYKHNIKSTFTPSSKKVKIISEKKISEPVLIKKSKLEPVSPSFVLKMPDRKRNLNAEMNSETAQTFNLNMANSQQGINIQEQTLVPNFQDTSIEQQAKSMALNKVNIKYTSHTPRSNLTANSVVDGNVSDTKALNAVPSEDIIVPHSVSSLYQNKSLPNPMVMAIEFEELNLNTNEQTNKLHKMLPDYPVAQELSQASVVNNNIESPSAQIPSSKVKIISEKNICDPVILKKSELEPVSPSVVLRMFDRKKNLNTDMNELGEQTFYFNMTNSQQGENIHELDSITSQPSVTNQMCLTEYAQPEALVDQIDNINVSEVMKVDLPMKLTVSSGPAHNDMQLKQESEQLTNLNLVLPDFVPTTSTSVTERGESYSTDVPPEATHSTGSEYVMNFTEVPIELEKGSSIANIETQTLRNSNKSGISKNKPRVLPTGPNNRSPRNLSKIKMPPEKAAAITEKRKFNMKLRDIIDSCLNKLDEEPEPDERKLSAAMKRKLSNRNVEEHLSKHPDLPSTQENNIAYFEARLQRMENTLLNKIEQNSQKIIDLKRVIKPLSGAKSAYTQTYFDAEATKKQLYQQISQFLSPEANNLVYEELFINKMISNTEPAHKKRKGS